MIKQTLILAVAFAPFAAAQDGSPTRNQAVEVKVTVAASTASVIAVPPEVSWTGRVTLDSHLPVAGRNPADLKAWLAAVSARNGLHSDGLQPWHITISYDQFDDNGDNIHSGTVDQLWAGPKQYRIRYQSDSLNQTDYATAQGLFRVGDQRWPNRTEIQVLAEIIDPFSYAASRQNVRAVPLERTFGDNSLDCVAIEQTTGGITGPNQYCFTHLGDSLRYVRGYGWNQTAYNSLTDFQGRHVAREVTVTDGGKPYLRLEVTALELVPHLDPSDFTPPPEATGLQGKRLSGVQMKALKTVFPEWPGPMRQQEFKVTLDIVVAKDGHVIDAHATSGPKEAYKAAENAARHWIFQPYLVLGEPSEVETKVILSNN